MKAREVRVLRRAENVHVFYKQDLWGLITRRYKMQLQVSKKTYTSSIRRSKAEFRSMQDRSTETPVRYMRIGDRTYWRFDAKWYTDNENLDAESVHALLVTRNMRQADQISRAKTIAAQGRIPQSSRRVGIPDDVKVLVWARDGGACRSCGSTTELQFDHVIPVARGGGNNEANLQVLCGPCNRRKSSGLTVGNVGVLPQQPVSSSPAPDWYQDPDGSGGLRYWDGQAWTDHTHKPNPAPS
jgi:hypothetical protein